MTMVTIHVTSDDAWWKVTDSKALRPPGRPGPYTPAIRLTVETGWSPPLTVDVPRNQAGSAASIQAYLKTQMEALYYASRLTGTWSTSVTSEPPEPGIHP